MSEKEQIGFGYGMRLFGGILLVIATHKGAERFGDSYIAYIILAIVAAAIIFTGCYLSRSRR